MENLVRQSALVSSLQQMKLEIWCGWAYPYKTIAKFIVHSIHIYLEMSTCDPLKYIMYNPILIVAICMFINPPLNTLKSSKKSTKNQGKNSTNKRPTFARLVSLTRFPILT